MIPIQMSLRRAQLGQNEPEHTQGLSCIDALEKKLMLGCCLYDR